MRKRAEFDLAGDPRPLLAAIVRNLARQARERALRDDHRRRDDLADHLEQIADRSTQERSAGWRSRDGAGPGTGPMPPLDLY